MTGSEEDLDDAIDQQLNETDFPMTQLIKEQTLFGGNEDAKHMDALDPFSQRYNYF